MPAEPMEMLTSSLTESVEPVQRPAENGHASADVPAKGASKCPFTGMVNEAMSSHSSSTIQWSDEAEERIARIPSFVQAMVRKSIEDHAREKGYSVIDAGVMNEVKGMFGM